jgi:hypothetical protein
LEEEMNLNQKDPVIDEIREVRHRISERFGHDPVQLVAYYLELQEQYRDRLIDAVKTPNGAEKGEAGKRGRDSGRDSNRIVSP